MLSRRHFLGASLATTVYAAGSFVPVWAQNAPNFGTPTLPSPGFRRMKVGDVEVIALNDGIPRRPAGMQAADIDTVLISHYHGDHINGIRNKAGELVFPKAKVMVPAAEHAFWMDDARMAAAPAGMKGAFDNVRRTFATMPADTLVQFAADAEVAPGIKSVAAYGHTPGHTLFELTSSGQKFFYVADLTNVPALFARNPDWAVTFDMDAEAARKVRRDVFQRITASNAMLGGFHFPFPAFGRMAASGNGYAFQPAA